MTLREGSIKTTNLQKHLEWVRAVVCEPFNPILRGCFVLADIFRATLLAHKEESFLSKSDFSDYQAPALGKQTLNQQLF